MKLIFIFLLLSSSLLILPGLSQKINSRCTKHSENENIEGTLSCLRESNGIYLPYFEIRAYLKAFYEDDCKKIKEIYTKYYKIDKLFKFCHEKWSVILAG